MATHLILVVVLLIGVTSLKKSKALDLSNRIGTEFGRNVLRVNTH